MGTGTSQRHSDTISIVYMSSQRTPPKEKKEDEEDARKGDKDPVEYGNWENKRKQSRTDNNEKKRLLANSDYSEMLCQLVS